jgi:hypothetical protein
MDIAAAARNITLSQAQYNALGFGFRFGGDRNRIVVQRGNITVTRRTLDSLHRLGLVDAQGTVTELGQAVRNPR